MRTAHSAWRGILPGVAWPGEACSRAKSLLSCKFWPPGACWLQLLCMSANLASDLTLPLDGRKRDHHVSDPSAFPPPTWSDVDSPEPSTSEPTQAEPSRVPSTTPAAQPATGPSPRPAQDPPAEQPAPPADPAPAHSAPAPPAPAPSAEPEPEPEPPAPPVVVRPSASDLLTSIASAHTEIQRPEAGWRAAVYNISGGKWNPGLSPEEQHLYDLRANVNTPLNGDLKVVFVYAQKGGMGKTTLVTNLGIALAQNRPDAVLGLDVNPDGGSLAIRVPTTTKRTILDFRDALRAFERSASQGGGSTFGTNDIDRYVNHASHRFGTIVMPPGTKPQHPLTGDDLVLIIRALRAMTAYKFVIIDCGTDLSAPVMDGVLSEADMMVVAASTIKDEAVVTIGGLEALVAEGRADLVEDAITVMIEKNAKDPRADAQRAIDLTADKIRSQFAQVTKEVISAPYDSRIRIGGVLDPNDISSASTKAYLTTAARLVHHLKEAEEDE